MLDRNTYASAAELPDDDPSAKANGKHGHARPKDEFSAAELQQMNFPPIAWIVRRYVAEGVTILAGKPKLGKSWLALDWAIAIARGGFAMGVIQCGEGDVLYLAMEDNQRRLQGRMRKLIGEVPWPDRLAFRTKLNRLDEGGTREVRAWLEGATKPRLVVVDVLASVRSVRRSQDTPYEADYAVLGDFKALADEFNVAILVVHHLRKMESDSDPFDMVSGTTGLTGAADTTLVLKSGSQGVTLYGRGRDVTEVEDAVTFDREYCRWKLLGDASEVRRSDERKQIIEALEEDAGELSPQEITRATGANSAAIRKMLGRMVKDGEVLKAKRGRYRLPLNPHHNGHNVTTDEGEE